MVDRVPEVVVKVLDADPAATVTDAGTVSIALLLDRETVNPPEGAPVDSVTVHVDELLLPSVEGVQLIELRTTGTVNEMFAVWETLL